MAEDVGRCNHESSCGYHRTPSMYFADNPEKERTEAIPPQKPIEIKTDYIDMNLIRQSVGTGSTLFQYLGKYFDSDILTKVAELYCIGCTKNKETIFPQIDANRRCRTGKVMQYGADGHRIKNPNNDAIDWLHARWMRKQGKTASDFHLKQCLFGEHLLPLRPSAVVCLVESEKSAIICSIVYPEFIWVSCGGKMGLTPERCKSLAGRNVLVYADADAVTEWSERIAKITYCKNINLSEWAKEEELGSKRDIADVIMSERKPIIKPTTIGDVCQWMKDLGIENDRITFNV